MDVAQLDAQGVINAALSALPTDTHEGCGQLFSQVLRLVVDISGLRSVCNMEHNLSTRYILAYVLHNGLSNLSLSDWLSIDSPGPISMNYRDFKLITYSRVRCQAHCTCTR
jgi:hypothetical protein